MEQIAVKSYAKINLFLEVTGKRADGYHNIRTIFQTIDLADEVVIEKASEGITLLCNDPEIPTDEKNIAYKAAKLIVNEGMIKSGLKIRIVKNIPVTAGLAGGSSNAAAVLNGCNKLFSLELQCRALFKMADKLGSDVPFLLKGGTQLGEGRGEILTELKFKPAFWLVMVIEGKKVSTGSIYGAFKNHSTKSKIFDKTIKELLTLNEISGGDLVKILYNDLEVPAEGLSPEIKTVKADLIKAGALGVLMSGSGPAVFGVAGTKKLAESIRSTLKNKYSRVFLTKMINPVDTGGV